LIVAVQAQHCNIERTPDMKMKILENVYEMVCELRLMYGKEIWGLGWGDKFMGFRGCSVSKY
jgi:hypothetical protein